MTMFLGVACLILAIWGVALVSAVVPRLLFIPGAENREFFRFAAVHNPIDHG